MNKDVRKAKKKRITKTCKIKKRKKMGKKQNKLRSFWHQKNYTIVGDADRGFCRVNLHAEEDDSG